MTQTVTWHRPRHSVVQWTVHYSTGETVTYHSNRAATFLGAYDGRYRHQLRGAAWSAWREDDRKVMAALKRRHMNCRVEPRGQAAG